VTPKFIALIFGVPATLFLFLVLAVVVKNIRVRKMPRDSGDEFVQRCAQVRLGQYLAEGHQIHGVYPKVDKDGVVTYHPFLLVEGKRVWVEIPKKEKATT
jgi:hypothetical protein